MAPRIQLPSALRQCQFHLLTQRAELSTTSPVAALRNLRDPSSRVLNLDDSGPATRRTGSGSGSGSSPTDALRDIYKDGDKYRRTAARRRTEIAETLRHKTISDQFLRQMPRQWRAGDVYAPHDLSPFEMKKWRRQGSPKKDVLDMLGVNPLDMYRNFSIVSEYMTPFGRIKHSNETGLRPVNQRKMARTIRRAIGLGLHPSVHRHPMILLKNSYNMPEQTRSSKSRF